MVVIAGEGFAEVRRHPTVDHLEEDTEEITAALRHRVTEGIVMIEEEEDMIEAPRPGMIMIEARRLSWRGSEVAAVEDMEVIGSEEGQEVLPGTEGGAGIDGCKHNSKEEWKPLICFV